MKAFLIDPWTKTITEVQIPRNKEKQLLAIYFQLSNPSEDWIVDMIETTPAGGENILLVDEDARIKTRGAPHFYYSTQVIFGKALVVGISEGDFIEPSLSLHQLSINTGWDN